MKRLMGLQSVPGGVLTCIPSPQSEHTHSNTLQSFNSIAAPTYAADQLSLHSYSLKTQRAFLF